MTDRDWADALLVHAALEIHADDPAFGYRFIADELPGKGFTAGENRVQRLCRDHRIWSVFSRKRGLNRKPGPPVHDDRVQRDFTATAPNQLWLTDITEHPKTEGKLYLCAVKDGQFQGASATPSFGGCRDGVVERSKHCLLNAVAGCFCSGNGEAVGFRTPREKLNELISSVALAL